MKTLLTSILVLLAISAFGQVKQTGWTTNSDPTTARNALGALGTNSPTPYSTNSGTMFNEEAFPNFRSYYETNWPSSSPSPLRILFLGDSLTQNKMSRGDYEESFRRTIGFNGYGFQGNISMSVSNGAWSTNDHTKWLGSVMGVVPASGSLTFSNSGTKYFYARRIDVPYITENGGGTFDIQVSTNFGAFTTWKTVNSDNGGNITLATTNLIVGTGFYSVRILGSSGTSRVIPPIFDYNLGRGVTCLDVSSAGQDWTSWTNVPLTVLTNLGYLYQTKLIVIEELSTASQWSNALPVITNIVNGSAFCDVMIVTPNPGANDSANSPANEVMKAYARQYGWVLFDQFSMFGSYTNMLNQQLIASADVHPNAKATRYATLQTVVRSGLGNTMLPGSGPDRPFVFDGNLSGVLPGIWNIDQGASASGEWDIVGDSPSFELLAFKDSRGTYRGGILADNPNGQIRLQAGSSTFGLFDSGGKSKWGLSLPVGSGALSNTFEIVQGASLPGLWITSAISNAPANIFVINPLGAVSNKVIVDFFGNLYVTNGLVTASNLVALNANFQSGMVTNNTLVWLSTNATPNIALPNGSIASVTDGRMFVRSNATWLKVMTE